MPWVRTSDTFTDWPIWEQLGAESYFLHMAALSYCNRSLTDGVLTRARAKVLTPVIADPDAAIDALLEAGVWTEAPGGIKVADYIEDMRRGDGRGDEQQAASSVQETRARAADRQAKWRASKKGNPVRNGVTNGSLPVPDPKGHGTGPMPPEADADHECVHGDPRGGELLPTGAPRCPQCRTDARRSA